MRLAHTDRNALLAKKLGKVLYGYKLIREMQVTPRRQWAATAAPAAGLADAPVLLSNHTSSRPRASFINGPRTAT
ncbi:hypothetical protein LRH25_30725 [Ideonella azotifigens]|uniref:Transposase n=1 Tax=Ideonella azotifigens TaxID=513160 RepID=A0ABP3US57_9BURK|nr:hypothetical protein [Ideonella azotifigens]MCD2344698.1 hypothetical protein [Ideonella azotifigens]